MAAAEEAVAVTTEAASVFLNLGSPVVSHWTSEFETAGFGVGNPHLARRNNFTKGVKFSPDGSCLLTNSDDNVLRIFEVPAAPAPAATTPEPCAGPSMASTLRSTEGETIYDFCWYPHMDPYKPETCCFLSTSRDHPIHLWDAYTGAMRCTYRGYNHLDEITAAVSLSFNLHGDKIYAGYNRMIRVFDVDRPGREFVSRHTSKTKKSKFGQKGLISAISFSPDYSGMFAAGSYAKSIGLYCESDRDEIMQLTGQRGGVTHLVWSPCGNYLWSGGRKDHDVLCWDIRKTADCLHSISRVSKTNQRLYFDIDSSGQHIFTGSEDGIIRAYSTNDGRLLSQFSPLPDGVNGISVHPSKPILACTTGQRHFDLPSDDTDTEADTGDTEIEVGEDSRGNVPSLPSANSLLLWNCAARPPMV
jgi:WD40 repeat protein